LVMVGEGLLCFLVVVLEVDVAGLGMGRAATAKFVNLLLHGKTE
jgi:hypothetical protein